MMGRRKSEQGQMIYAFDLDAVVPDDHLVRQIASVLDISWVRKDLTPHYSQTGRPSIDGHDHRVTKPFDADGVRIGPKRCQQSPL